VRSGSHIAITLRTRVHCFLSQSAVVFGSNRTHVPMRNEGMRPAFAWACVDLRTVQQWLGHSDMESTMRYLKPSRRQHVRDKVNEIFA